ncbi:hypothetical protein [Streptomyces sp. NPDC047043]|uniref:hypothetical protein n=1 Tax=Streptomyces sp. NPDC047043 TaxID=3154497 RepID=UPI0033E11E47
MLILSTIGGSRVTSAEYTVELSHNARVLGGGFRMTRHFVLTADHHLGSEIGERTSVDLQLSQGLRIVGTVEQRCPEADLALIRLYKEDLIGPEIYFGQARSGERWRTAHPNPCGGILHGTILNSFTFHHGDPGRSAVEVLVLDCAGADDEEQQANRTAYTGRMGMPIERAEAVPFPVVLGVAIRLNNGAAIAQGPDGQPQLVAATVGEALKRLGRLRLTAVIEEMWPTEPFRIDEVQKGIVESYRETYANEVRARLREFGFITPVTIPSALTRANDETEGQ